ncbi:MAG: hypothetical protein WC169_02250 [Dehalococcoidia bacterium]|jgi:hypothetical protein
MIDLSLAVLLVSLAVALAGVAVWIYQLFSRPSACDPSPGKGSDKLGVLYAFTLGMLPWKKESAGLHKIVYLRGICFHIGIFAGIVALILSIFGIAAGSTLNLVLSILMWIGAVAGVTAIISRATEANLRGISRPDDYISPALITLFMSMGALHAMNLVDTVYFYAAASVLCLYLPWSKVRHCVYFFFMRGKIGAMMGHRGLLGTTQRQTRKGTP